MTLINIQQPKPHIPPTGFALFALGFRPFFLAAGLFGVLFMGGWLAMLKGALPAPGGVAAAAWHGHEMLFGYAVAVIGGFLLTATQNWTGSAMPKGAPLAALFALWLAGRLLPYLPVPYLAAAIIDLLFLPALAIAVLRPVLRIRQKRNYAFAAILLCMTASNALFHAAALGCLDNPLAGLAPALYFSVLMIVVMGGRVIPYFIERRVGSTATRWRAVEWLAPATTIAVLLAALAAQEWQTAGALLVPLGIAAAIVHALRLYGWHARRLWEVPLLWVLYLGYAWLVIGFLLDALAAAGLVSPFLAMHAYTTGGIGVMTLGMMARVALGHTGRPLEPPKIMAWAFAALNLAALVRVFGPLLFPGQTALAHLVGGALWMTAFAAFTAAYAPMLWRPRTDGKPG